MIYGYSTHTERERENSLKRIHRLRLGAGLGRTREVARDFALLFRLLRAKFGQYQTLGDLRIQQTFLSFFLGLEDVVLSDTAFRFFGDGEAFFVFEVADLVLGFTSSSSSFVTVSSSSDKVIGSGSSFLTFEPAGLFFVSQLFDAVGLDGEDEDADLSFCFLNMASIPSFRSETGLMKDGSSFPTLPTSLGTG